ncbi:MAG: hypothetical protein JW909_04070 [Planctomycetes bacterium]|nr:hypothetical protein [Planctomycetota bacterium]
MGALEYTWYTARALAIAAVAVAVAGNLKASLAAMPERHRPWGWASLLIPLLCPPVLVGYGYSSISIMLSSRPRALEALYMLVMLSRYIPLAAAVLVFAPGRLSRQAVHCHGLLKRKGLKGLAAAARFRLEGPARDRALACALMFLFVFAEFETATLMFAPNWTVSIFDAHAGGTSLWHSLRMVAVPLAVQIAVVGLVFLGLRGREWTVRRLEERAVSPGRPAMAGALLSVAFCWTAGVIVPATRSLRGLTEGLGVVAKTASFWKDLAAGLLFASVTAAVTLAAVFFAGRRLTGRGVKAGVPMVVAPGLLGPLVLSLCAVAVFQAPGLRLLYDTPVPLVTILALCLLPVGLLMGTILVFVRHGTAVHLAAMLKSFHSAPPATAGRRLLWRMRNSRAVLLYALIFFWAYFDFTASWLLHPVGMTPVVSRLYNLMHYGHSNVLSAMLGAALAAPVAVGAAVYLAARLAARVRSHG